MPTAVLLTAAKCPAAPFLGLNSPFAHRLPGSPASSSSLAWVPLALDPECLELWGMGWKGIGQKSGWGWGAALGTIPRPEPVLGPPCDSRKE